MSEIKDELNNCLYFTSNKLSRMIGKMAEQEFKITRLSPTYAFLLSIVNKKEGIVQKEIGEILHMSSSTITRFIDKLENKNLLKRVKKGKNSLIYLTEKGKQKQAEIDQAWDNLHQRYEKIIGPKEAEIVENINKISNQIEKEVK